jgi:hypothetical protein
MARRPVKRTRGGRYQLNLSRDERDVLRTLPSQLRDLLADTDDPGLRRLFPPAYQDEPEAEAEYRRLMLDDLIEHRRATLSTMEATVDAAELSEEEVSAWLGALNDLRLVLGTRLDVTEEEDPRQLTSPAHALYYFLGYLQECVIEALSGS